jgi:hypothetical protein
MALELDHVLICTAAGAPEADELVRFGLVEGAPNRHPGQGTANRRFFFDNAFLELLWVDDAAAAQSPLVAPTGLWERWSRRAGGASPLGVCFRPAAGAPPERPPFPAWEYRPPYLPAPLAIHMAADSADAAGPLLFYLAFGRPARSADAAHRQPLDHGAGVRTIAAASFTSPGPISPAARTIERLCPEVTFAQGAAPLVELTFDSPHAARTADFRPRLPLVFRW